MRSVPPLRGLKSSTEEEGKGGRLTAQRRAERSFIIYLAKLSTEEEGKGGRLTAQRRAERSFNFLNCGMVAILKN